MSWGFLRSKATRRTILPQVLELAERAVPLILVQSRQARRLTLRADPATGAVRLTVPRGARTSSTLAFLTDQHSWLEARVARWPLPLPVVPGAVLPFRGDTLTLDWTAGHSRTPCLDGGVLRMGGPAEGLPQRVERWMRHQAHAFLDADCTAIAARIDRPAPPVRVGDPKGRWGSCSARGTLAFSWRLVMAPDFVRRAVAAHEVAHLVHHNHGPAFHALCAELSDGDARQATRWLAQHGAALHWVGRS